MKKNWWRIGVYFIAMLVLILDAKTAAQGAADGVGVCLETVIPALFPLLILAILINNAVNGRKIKVLEPVRKICGIPKGAESILVLGLTGGYPVGAQCIYQSYRSGQLSRSDSQRMLMFCNNAGPAFIFGISASLFSQPLMPWRLWLVHIISAVMVGILVSDNTSQCEVALSSKRISFVDAMNTAMRTLGNICCWVILFRICIHILIKWLRHYCSADFLIVMSGLLELTNGCIESAGIPDESVRFVLISAFLGFGGCCVAMQTAAVVKELGIKTYIIGKLMQGTISILLSVLLLQNRVFSGAVVPFDIVLLSTAILCTVTLKHIIKKTVAFQKNVMYNRKKGNNEV